MQNSFCMKQLHRKRKVTFNTPGEAHELTFSCYRRLPLIDFDFTRQAFLGCLDQARQRWSFEIWAYVLMPEHVHLIVNPLQQQYRMEDILKAIKKPVAKPCLDWLACHHPALAARLAVRRTSFVQRHFWQRGGGYDRNLFKGTTIWRTIEYVHDNPVRRGLAGSQLDWPWSSARWYAE